MKKMMIALALVAAATCAKAAMVDWKVTGTAATVNETVYMFVAIDDTYATWTAFETAANSYADIKQTGSGSRASYATPQVAAEGADITVDSMKKAIFAVKLDESRYAYIEQDISTKVYDPTAQEGSKGVLTGITYASIASSGSTGTIGEVVPEPTSGLLMLLGMAGLALRRRRA